MRLSDEQRRAIVRARRRRQWRIIRTLILLGAFLLVVRGAVGEERWNRLAGGVISAVCAVGLTAFEVIWRDLKRNPPGDSTPGKVTSNADPRH